METENRGSQEISGDKKEFKPEDVEKIKKVIESAKYNSVVFLRGVQEIGNKELEIEAGKIVEEIEEVERTMNENKGLSFEDIEKIKKVVERVKVSDSAFLRRVQEIGNNEELEAEARRIVERTEDVEKILG